MTSTLTEHTILPQAADTYDAIVDLLNEREIVFISAESSSRVQLSDDLLRVFRDVVDTLHRGDAVTVVPRATRLTTQHAADLLGVSRPTLVKLLEAGEIAYEQPSRHRYVQLNDLLAYQERQRQHRRKLLHGMAREAAERLDDEPDAIVSTR